MIVVTPKTVCNILLVLCCILSWRQLYIILISSITISKQDFMVFDWNGHGVKPMKSCPN